MRAGPPARPPIFSGEAHLSLSQHLHFPGQRCWLLETPVPHWWPRDTGACDSGGVSVTHESQGGGKGVLFTVSRGHGQDVNFRGPLVLALPAVIPAHGFHSSRAAQFTAASEVHGGLSSPASIFLNPADSLDIILTANVLRAGTRTVPFYLPFCIFDSLDRQAFFFLG